jgi:hypothetical protein
MLQQQLHVVNDGLINHEAFRNTIRNGVNDEELQTPAALPSTTSAPHGEQNGQATTPPGNQGKGNGVGPTTNPGEPHPQITPTPKNDHPTPGNNAGGNDKDKGKDKDKDKDKDKKDKTPKGPK